MRFPGWNAPDHHLQNRAVVEIHPVALKQFGLHVGNYANRSDNVNSCIGVGAEQIRWGNQDVMFCGGGEEEHWSLSALFDAMGAAVHAIAALGGRGGAPITTKPSRCAARASRTSRQTNSNDMGS
jgi:hypothetical protein